MAEQPLAGRTIVITRPERQADGLAERLRARAAIPISCPAIAIEPPTDPGPLDSAIARLSEFDWLIVTSANGAQALARRAAELGVDRSELARPKIGAIGPATAQALAEQGLRADFVPSSYVAEGILEQIGEVQGARILLPRADIARDTLAVGLRARGALVDEVAAYRTVPGPGGAALLERMGRERIDAITFTSSSTVRFLLGGMQASGVSRHRARAMLHECRMACIGPITARTAREEGLRVDAVAAEYTAEGLVQALESIFRQTSVAR